MTNAVRVLLGGFRGSSESPGVMLWARLIILFVGFLFGGFLQADGTSSGLPLLYRFTTRLLVPSRA